MKTNHTALIYVEKSFNADFNNFIATNYLTINRQLEDREYQLLYLPLLLKDSQYREILSYNRPYLEQLIDSNQINLIYSELINRSSELILAEGLVCISSDYFGSSSFYGYPLDRNQALQTQIDDFIRWIEHHYSELKDAENTPLFKLISDEDDDISEINRSVESGSENNRIDYIKTPLFRQIRITDDPDFTFSLDAYQLAEEIKIRIMQLSETGSIHLLDEIIEEVLNVKKKLSRIFITDDYRIFLKDFKMKEVVMAPLPKALYLLFLRHPEGILFKHLADYRDELMSIYKNVTRMEDIDRAMTSIVAMTDPSNNSINEKCSRIREAYLNVIADDLAVNYYITGNRGEPKKVILDRSLVTFQE